MQASQRIIRARYLRSERTRRDWVRYVHDIDAEREIERGAK